jgi:uncharacterized protein
MGRQAPFFTLGLAAAGLGLGAYWLNERARAQRRAQWRRTEAGERAGVALVTGASSGIGAAYARRLAQMGYDLVLVARRQERLQALADELAQDTGCRSEILTADLTTDDGIAQVEQRLRRNDVSFLVNNAGFGVMGHFAEVPVEKSLAVTEILVLAVMRLTRAALPGMLTRRHGAIVNVSSLASFVAKPMDATYVASKAYVTFFSESVAMEVSGLGVRVQALCPGFTHTEFHDDPHFQELKIKESLPPWMWMSAEQVVQISLDGLAEDRQVVVPGLLNKGIAYLSKAGLARPLITVFTAFFPKDSAQQMLFKPMEG